MAKWTQALNVTAPSTVGPLLMSTLSIVLTQHRAGDRAEMPFGVDRVVIGFVFFQTATTVSTYLVLTD